MDPKPVEASSAVQSYFQEPPSPLGAFNKMPSELSINILSKLPNPLSVCTVSKPLKVLGEAALDQQLLDRGLSATQLSPKLRISFDNNCIVLLLKFSPSFAEIPQKNKEDALELLSLIIGERYDLLQNPQELQKVLKDQASIRPY